MSDTRELYAAAHAGDLAAVRVQAPGAGLDTTLNPMGWTALMTAAAQGHAEVLRWLLVAGADPNVVGDDASALTLAAGRGHGDVVALLADRPDVDVDHRDGRGFTALMGAALRGHDDVVATLLRRDDLRVNAADVDGRTALIWAASAGHAAVARRLARDGRVAVAHAAGDGVTPADAARDAGLVDLGAELDRLASEDRPQLVASDYDVPPPASRVPPGARPIREPTRRPDRG